MLNPLNKLRRFSSAQKANSAPSVPAAQEAPRNKAIPGDRLPEDQIQKLINPLAKNCKHCKAPHSTKNFVFFTQGPSINGWFCFECMSYWWKHKILPAIAPKRVLPKKV